MDWLCLRVYASVSFCLSLSVFVSLYLDQFMSVSVPDCFRFSVCLFVYIFHCVFECLCVCEACLHDCLSKHVYLSMSVCLLACLYLLLSACLSVCVHSSLPGSILTLLCFLSTQQHSQSRHIFTVLHFHLHGQFLYFLILLAL